MSWNAFFPLVLMLVTLANCSSSGSTAADTARETKTSVSTDSIGTVQQALANCASVPEWMVTTYSGGQRVQHNAVLYECRSWPYTAWCAQAGYEPGVTPQWGDAWIRVHECGPGAPPTIREAPVISQGRPTFASGVENDQLGPEKATDSSTSTRWGSPFSNDHWIYVDLGERKHVNGVVLSWEAAYAHSYKIQTSDNATDWVTVFSTTNGDGNFDTIRDLNVPARYVRVLGVERATPYGYSLYAFNVHGTNLGTESILLSRFRRTYASSLESEDFRAENAADDNESTRWSSAFSHSQWIAVDLGGVKHIDRVRLNWEAAFGRSYKIQVSTNGSQWTDVFSTSSGDGGVDDVAVNVESRFVRMLGVQRATPYGYSLFDFEVFGRHLNVPDVAFALRAGEKKVTSAGDGVLYFPDQYFTHGSVASFGASTDILRTNDDSLFRSERYGTFSYAIPVADGQYRLVLQFAESYWNESGRRAFHVSAEGVRLLENLDVFALVGRNAALERSFSVRVDDGELNLDFETVRDNAKLSALRLEPIRPELALEHPYIEVLENGDLRLSVLYASYQSSVQLHVRKNGIDLAASNIAASVIPNPDGTFSYSQLIGHDELLGGDSIEVRFTGTTATGTITRTPGPTAGDWSPAFTYTPALIPPFADVPGDSIVETEESGRLVTSGTVDHDGSYTHEIPIRAPRGRAGMEPRVSLRYRSSSGDGPLGVGWTLNATSTIRRCSRIQASEGDLERLLFDAMDRFCMDGQRLVLVSGEYAANGSEYRTEVDTYSRIRISAVGADGTPSLFTVETRDGKILRYGGTFTVTAPQQTLGLDGAVVSTRTVTVSWPLTVEMDRSGNTVEYQYVSDAGSATQLLSRIDYTGFSGLTRYRKFTRAVVFTYEAGPSREGYVSGVRFANTQLLKHIDLFAPPNHTAPSSSLAGRYELRYATSLVSQRPLLAGVRRCDGVGRCMPETTFQWQGTSASDLPFEVAGATGGAQFLREFPLVESFAFRDFDPDTGEFLNITDTFAGDPESAFALFDANGDGNDDIAFKHWPGVLDGGIDFSDTPLDLLLLGADGFFAAPRRLLNSAEEVADFSAATPIDLDGDGLLELVAPMNEDVYQGQLIPFTEAQLLVGGCNLDCPQIVLRMRELRDLAPIVHNVFSLDTTRRYRALSWDAEGQTMTNQTGWGFPGSNDTWEWVRLLFADISGDRLPDIFSTRRNSTGPSLEPHWRVATSTPLSPAQALPGARIFTAYQDQGTSLLPAREPDTLKRNTYAVTDEDGDGRMELHQRRLGAHEFYTQDRLGAPEVQFFGTSHPLDLPEGSGNWHFIDINGDGLKDVLRLYKSAPGALPLFVARLNTGSGYLPEYQAGTPSSADFALAHTNPVALQNYQDAEDIGIRVGDFTGDGRDDFLLIDPGTAPVGETRSYRDYVGAHRLFVSDGVQFSSMPFADHGLNRLQGKRLGWFSSQVGDIDGNGLADVVEFVRSPTNPHLRRFVSIGRSRLRGGTDLIVEVRDVRGVAEEIEYDNLSAHLSVSGGLALSTAHTADNKRPVTGEAPNITQCAYPARCISSGRAVVRSYANHRQQQDVRTSYEYEGARADALGRGFLGVRRTTVHDQISGMDSFITFSQARVAIPTFAFPYIYPDAFVPQATISVLQPEFIAATDLIRIPEPIATVASRTRTGHYNGILRVEREQVSTVVVQAGELQNQRLIDTWFDDFGNVTSHADEYTGGRAITTTRTYDIRESDWLISLPDHEEVVAMSPETPNNPETTRTTDFVWDSLGRLFERTVEKGNTGLELTERVQRDAAGLVQSVSLIDGEGQERIQTISHDRDGVFPRATIDPLGHLSWFGFHPAVEQLAISANANRVTTRTKFDGFGRIREQVNADGSGAAYSHASFLSRMTPFGVSFPVITVFDAHGRVQRREWSDFSSQFRSLEFTYNSLGLVATQTLPGATSATRFEYDVLGRPVTKTLPNDAGTTTLKYPTLNRIEQIDGEGDTQIADLTPDGLVSVVTQFLETRTSSEFPDTTPVVTRYYYGPFRQLERIVDHELNNTRFDFDTRGRQTAIHDPDAGHRTFGFDAFGGMVREEDAARGAITYHRDLLGRVKRVESEEGVSSYVWDSALRGIGQLGSTTSADGIATTYSYDSLGRPDTVTWNVAGINYQVSSTYDEFGRPETLLYPASDGERVAIEYRYKAGKGLLETVLDARTNSVLWRVNTRDPFGLLKETTTGSGTRTIRTYDPDIGRLTQIQSEGAEDLLAYRYDFYKDGNIRNRTHVLSGAQTTYSYDSLDRLVESLADQTRETFAYDLIGNFDRVSTEANGALTATEYAHAQTFGAGPHGATDIGDQQFRYDEAGRQTERYTSGVLDRVVTYNNNDLPIQIEAGTGANSTLTRFSYDAANMRVLKVSPGSSVVSIAGLYERRTSNNGVTEVFKVPTDDGTSVEITRRAGSETVAYLHKDILGSVVAREGSGEPELIDYQPFGARESTSGALPKAGFTGHDHDDELGLINMKGRIYDPVQRHFLSPDPILANPLNPGALNPYGYVHQNPLNFIDPFGLQESKTVELRDQLIMGDLRAWQRAERSAERRFDRAERVDLRLSFREEDLTYGRNGGSEAVRNLGHLQGLFQLAEGDPSMREAMKRRELFTDAMAATSATSVVLGEVFVAASAPPALAAAMALRTLGGAVSSTVSTTIAGGNSTAIVRSGLAGAVVSAANPFGGLSSLGKAGRLMGAVFNSAGSNIAGQTAAIFTDGTPLSIPAAAVSGLARGIFGVATGGIAADTLGQTLIFQTGSGINSGLIHGAVRTTGAF